MPRKSKKKNNEASSPAAAQPVSDAEANAAAQPADTDNEHIYNSDKKKDRRKISKRRSKENRRRLKWYFLVPLVLFVFVALVFIVWQIKPARVLNVALLDKTVPTADSESIDDVSNYYRKHLGFYWLLEQQKFVMSTATDSASSTDSDGYKFYDYMQDYFGPKLLPGSTNVVGNSELSDISYDPDFMYVADVYGSELHGREYSGLSRDDMGVVSLAHAGGATVVAEMEIFNSVTEESVSTELQGLCGITPTTWVGRYIFELQDFSDVPEWAPPMYEQLYGVEWKFEGPGILFVSSDGDLLILEEKTDFNSKNLMEIYVNEAYEDEFGGCDKVNFYNWFELVEADYDTEVLAYYDFDFNVTGMEKFAIISDSSTFAAATRKNYDNDAPVYYFAGDFNDYVTKEKFCRFMFADTFFRALSFERSGDVTNFFWNFYTPMMKRILNSTYDRLNDGDDDESSGNGRAVGSQGISRVSSKSFEVLVDGKWQELEINGVNLNAEMPGDQPYEYSRDMSAYESLIASAIELGANCIRAYDLLPPEFYRAIYQNNTAEDAHILYIVQTIAPSDTLAPSEYLTDNGIDTLKDNVAYTMKAVNGKGAVPAYGSRVAATYRHNVSAWVMSYLVDLGLDAETVSSMTGVAYSAATPTNLSTATDATHTDSPSPTVSSLISGGTDFSGISLSASGSATESLVALICDYTHNYCLEEYGYPVPVGAAGCADILSGAAWSVGSSTAYSLDDISVSEKMKPYFYISYSLKTSDDVYLSNEAEFEKYTDATGAYAYGGYISAVKRLHDSHPVLIDALGISTNSNAFSSESPLKGVSEEKQGQEIVRMLRSADFEGFLGGFIADLNDNWSACSDKLYPYTNSFSNNPLWQNLLDPAQTTGIIAAEAPEPSKIGVQFTDFSRMQNVRFASNESYIYLTVMLSDEIDFDSEELYFGFDTYQRNDGEYMFDKAYFANSLSGMEYIIHFNSKESASLYVTKSYDRSAGNLVTKESYSADFSLVSNLVYGSFTSSTNHFYQAGATIYMRIPWSMFNFTDPSQKVVINDSTGGTGSQVRTVITRGLLFYITVINKKNSDTMYIFPESKQSAGYKTFQWEEWEEANYSFRNKLSFDIISSYFAG